MKIVDKKTFLAMPAGVLFSKFEPIIFGALSIKGATISDSDFFVQDIADAVACSENQSHDSVLDAAMESKSSFALNLSCEGRDGMYDDSQLFAVWESQDVASLIARLQLCQQ